MAAKARNFLCGCCGPDSASISTDGFPLAKNQNCVSMGMQTDSFKCRSYCQQENQNGYQQDYPLDYQQEYLQDYPQEYIDPCAEAAQYYSNQYGSELLGYRSYDDPVGSRYKYNDDASRYQNHPSMTRNINYGEKGYQKKDEMRCKYDPLSSRFRNYDAVDGYQNEVTRDGDDHLTGQVGRDGKKGNGRPGASTNGYEDAQGGKGKFAKKGKGHPGDSSDGHEGTQMGKGKVGKKGKGKPGDSSDGHEGTQMGNGRDGKKGKGWRGGTQKGNADGVSTGKSDVGGMSDDDDDADGVDGDITTTGSHHRQNKQDGGSNPTGLTRTATVMQCNLPPFPSSGPFSSNARPFSALPYFRSSNGFDPAGNAHESGQNNYPGSFRRRATDPGNLHSQSMMETRDRRRRNLSSPFPRPPVTTYSIQQANYSENRFNPRDCPRDIWQNNNNPQAYLFGWGKKKAAKNTGDGSNKLKMLYQINNAGVTCNCGQRMQFNLSVEENEGRCVACFEELRQDFADLLDLYKEMGYSPCECKGRISVTDLANEYIMDQANNASGRGYENVGAPRKKGPVKTIELTPTEGFTGCMCREIKMEMFRKPSDLISCQCDTDRPKVVLRPPSDYLDDDDDVVEIEGDYSLPEEEPEHEEESEIMSEPESETDYASNPTSRSDSSLKTPTKSSAETVYSVDIRGSTASAFVGRIGRMSIPSTASSKQSSSSNTASYETASSDSSSIQSNKTFIIPNRN